MNEKMIEKIKNIVTNRDLGDRIVDLYTFGELCIVITISTCHVVTKSVYGAHGDELRLIDLKVL